MPKKTKILVIGAAGQIGSELTMGLRKVYGDANVVAGYHKNKPGEEILESGPCTFVNCMQARGVNEVVRDFGINRIYHLAAILSATAEKKPLWAWELNVDGLLNVLEAARLYNCAVFSPSSIGAFGSSTPLDNTPQDTIQRPGTIYGISKVAGELLCDYYFQKFGVDTRSVRYPGIISNVTLPGGGTTDYAVEIFYEAIKNRRYVCYLRPNTYLDMMYMPDAIKAAIDLMEADPSKLEHRNSFNVSAMSFCPRELRVEIIKHIPDLDMSYEIDPVRQAIADSWPNCMDDSAARKEWGWRPDYNLVCMAEDMIKVLKKKLLS